LVMKFYIGCIGQFFLKKIHEEQRPFTQHP
jgi:hypothetical protein